MTGVTSVAGALTTVKACIHQHITKVAILYTKQQNMTLITTALAAYKKSGKLCFQPVRCLDGIGSTGIMGLMWRKHVPDNKSVTIYDPRPKTYKKIKANVKLNEAEIEVLNKDTCVLLYEKAFNFISLDCHTIAACYLDSVRRNLPKGGILALTTTNDAALHAVTPEIALKNYGGFITRNFYLKKLAVRLFLPAVARTLITTALAAYIKSGKLCFQPVRCLDGIGSTGIMGLMWRKHVPDNISVTINDPRPKAYERIKANVKLNEAEIEVLNKDTCVLLHEKAFNFISLDCHTTAACYLDSVMRNLPKGGILALTTTDDAALHAITPEIALRNYGGFITRTFYLKELAVRLFLAAVARAAARYNKGLQVLCSVAFKSSFTVILTVRRGPTHANKSISNIRKLIHCSMCEDRAFYPLTNYPINTPTSLLGCECSHRLPGKVAVELGPIWCGSIFNEEFLATMLEECNKFPWKLKTAILIRQLLTESRCSNKNENKIGDQQKNSEEAEEEIIPSKRLKLEEETEENDLVPPFYFNLHRHSPKGPQLLRVDTVVQHLHRAGYRASRTHFDREAVRTTASLVELTRILLEASSIAAS